MSSITATQFGQFISTTGFSTYTHEREFPKTFTIKKEQLWKLVKVINGETLMYPIEVIIRRDKKNKDHFLVKPQASVRLEIFRQVSPL